MLKCKQCGQEKPPVFAVNRADVLAGAAHIVVAAEKLEAPEHFDAVFCGKKCFMAYMSDEADKLMGIEPALHEGMAK